MVANVSKYVAEVVGELSQFKILLSKIGEKRTKNKGRKEQGNFETRESDKATKGRRDGGTERRRDGTGNKGTRDCELVIADETFRMMTNLFAQLCALGDFALNCCF